MLIAGKSRPYAFDLDGPLYLIRTQFVVIFRAHEKIPFYLQITLQIRFSLVKFFNLFRLFFNSYVLMRATLNLTSATELRYSTDKFVFVGCSRIISTLQVRRA